MISVYFFIFMFVLAWLTKITCTRFADKFCGILLTIVTLEIILRRCWTFGHSILKLEKIQLCTCMRYFFQYLFLKKNQQNTVNLKKKNRRIRILAQTQVSIHLHTYFLAHAPYILERLKKVSFLFGKQLRQNLFLCFVKPLNTVTNL